MRKCLNHLEFLFLVSLVLCYLSHSLTANATNNSRCIEHEREALLKFKQGIKYDYCGFLSSWGDTEDCCLWHGIRCSNHTGHVIALHLHGSQGLHAPNPCLEGKLDGSLFELKHLKSLDLSLNTFSQGIPKQIGSATNLQHLNFSSAAFTGKIPHELGNLSRLVSLDLSANVLFTPVKTLNWLSSLTLLRDLRLSGSNLSEVANWFQIVNSFPRLEVLYLVQCQLSPLNYYSSSVSHSNSSTTLRVLDISMNDLGSSVYQWLSDLSKIGNQFEYLDLSYNKLQGPPPSELGFMLSLRVLDLSFNDLQGSIPKSYGNLCKLESLDLSVNRLVDDFSNVLQILLGGCNEKLRLESLDLGDNQVSGSVPDMISEFSSLRVLSLGSNRLNGTISQGIGQLSMLETLFLYNNSLEGVVSHKHLNLSRLTSLALSNNRALEFSVNADWVPPFQLDIIGLGSCKLGPSFPKWLLTQTNFSYLDISNSEISDSIPAVFWTESLSFRVHTLNVSHNRIRGKIPNLSTRFDDLFDVDLSSNYFEGPIPSFLGDVLLLYLNDNLFSDSTHLLCQENQTNLWYLDLSSNLLHGELPNCFMKSQQLQGLHLEDNNFSGNIPDSIGALPVLQILHLENNNFCGELPISFQNCTNLISLNIGYNSLTGYIPSWIGYAFTRLAILNLRRNHFLGRLPFNLCQLSNLQILDLADNRLTGKIPKCFGNLTAMVNGESSGFLPFISAGQVYNTDGSEFTLRPETTVIEWKTEEQKFRLTTRFVILIDLSCNELEGEIPDEISSLKGLISLDLSRNNLSGSLSSDIGQLTSLELLNLSNNHLSGKIPTSLAKVTFLGILDLSNNNLSGKIPTSTQLQGFNTSSYVGNPFLCGPPLSQCSGDKPPTKTPSGETQQDSDDVYPGLYIAPVLGFIIGFWGVCGTLVIKRSWRHSFFRFLDELKDKLCVMWVFKVARAWRNP